MSANKCLNVRERVELVEWNKRRSPPFPCYPVSRQCPWKKTSIEKNICSCWQVRDRLQISLLIWLEFKWIDYLLFPPEVIRKPIVFWGNESYLIHLNSLNIRNGIGKWSLSWNMIKGTVKTKIRKTFTSAYLRLLISGGASIISKIL